MNSVYKQPVLSPDVVIDPKAFSGFGEGRNLIERLENKIRLAEQRLLEINREIEERERVLSDVEGYVRKEAEKRCEDIIKKAEEEAKKKVDGISEEAYKKGFAEGKTEGKRKGEIEANRLIATFSNTLTSLSELYEEAIKKVEAEVVVGLAIMIAEKIIKEEIKENKKAVLSNICVAIKRGLSEESVTVLVNLGDFDVAEEWKERLLKSSKTKRIDIREDSSIEQGGCKIQTGFGIIDATISSQLQKIKEEVLEYESKRA
ncbi:MAG: FliH/SctL family protein [bacterium]|nr:FliH/SctL family protein [bacterium]